MNVEKFKTNYERKNKMRLRGLVRSVKYNIER